MVKYRSHRNKRRYPIQTIDGISVDRPSFEAQIDATDIEKGTYPYYMLKKLMNSPS